MQIECIDLETDLMQDGLAAPPMVCLSWSDGERAELLVPWEGPDPYARFENILRDKSKLLINQHVFYDLGVLCNERPHLLPLVFEAIEAGRIRCLKVREQLIRIALGQAKFIDVADDEEIDDETAREKTRFDLAAIAKRWLGIHVEKEDTWRKSYALLRGIPLAHWPQDAIDYPLNDARLPLLIWAKQEEHIAANFEGGFLPGEVDSCCAAWALHLMKCWGVRTCPEAVQRLREELQAKVLWTTIGLHMAGILRTGGTKAKPKAVETKATTQRRVVEAFLARGESAPMTPPSATFPDGQVKASRKVLEDTKDPVLAALAEHKGYVKILSTYIPRYVERGVRVPITADWNPLVESFRISCANPNLTNPPRAGDVRSCFKARDGYVYVSADFDQAELRSWAQVCLVMFGHSKMAEAFKVGMDPHLMLAADLLGISFEEAARRYAEGDKEVEEKRQFSKEPNFGLIGGMGFRKFVERAALKGIIITEDYARETRETWMTKTWPEAKEYLDFFGEHFDEPRTIEHPITGFVRGDCGYSDGANHLFQHLTAIGTKQALWDLSKECYLDSASPLYGARPVLDMHDELFGEIPEENSPVGALRWGAVMQRGMEKWVRDVPVKCTPVLTRRLYKGAKPVLVNGVLVPSKPVKIDGKTKWVADMDLTSFTALEMAA